MLGYTQPNNDVYIFFENDEIERLKNEKIQGTYFNLNNPYKIGLLEASINDEINDRMITSAKRDGNLFFTWFLIEMRTREYESFIERKRHGLHEGYRHICLIDASKPEIMDLSNKINYQQLKYWQS